MELLNVWMHTMQFTERSSAAFSSTLKEPLQETFTNTTRPAVRNIAQVHLFKGSDALSLSCTVVTSRRPSAPSEHVKMLGERLKMIMLAFQHLFIFHLTAGTRFLFAAKWLTHGRTF